MIPSIWLFSGDRENVRYCLGEAKKKNIIVVGVNPGMQMPGEKQITTRNAVKVIYKTICNKCTWYYYDKLTHKNNPEHPRSAQYDKSYGKLENFSVSDYLTAKGY